MVWCAQVCALDLCPIDSSVYRSDFLELQVCDLRRAADGHPDVTNCMRYACDRGITALTKLFH